MRSDLYTYYKDATGQGNVPAKPVWVLAVFNDKHESFLCLFVFIVEDKNSTRDAVYGITAWNRFREQKLATTRCDSPAAVLWNNAGHQTAAGCKETETLCPWWRCLSGAVVRIEWTKRKKTFFFSVSWTVRLISVPAPRTCVDYARAPNPRNWRTVTLLAEI